jgi:hypothetical protein
MSDTVPVEEKVLFKNNFMPSEEDRYLLSFFENKFVSVYNKLKQAGYSKNAIADGVIYVINQWRNRP